jgi:hypothetical protein
LHHISETALTCNLILKGKEWIKPQINVNTTETENVTIFNYPECQLSRSRNYDLQKLQRSNYFCCEKIKRILLNKSQREAALKLYKFVAVPSLLW